MKNHRILALLLALTMLLGLCACGKDEKSDDPNHFVLGDYTLDYKGSCIMYDEAGRDSLVMTFDFTNNSKEIASCGWVISTKYMQGGVEMDSAYVIADIDTYASVAEKFYTDIEPGVTLEVKNAHLLSDMSQVNVTISELWSGKSYTLTVDPSTLERIENDVSSTDWSDWDYDSEQTEEEPAKEEPEAASFTDWWEGDWYGWWGIRSGSGTYEDYDGYWWDACAVLSLGAPAEDSAYNATLTVWDEDGSRTEGLIGEIEVTLSPYGVGEHGTMYSESGSFMDHVLEHADWIIDPALENVDDLITIDGEYSGEEGSYSYMVVLRPWGTMWDDVEESSLPYYYNDWYLPLIINGASMPDSLSETGGEAPSEEEPESTDAPSAAATGNQVPFSIDGTTMDGLSFTFDFSLPEGLWDMETYKFPYDFKIHNCPDGDDVPWDTPFIWVRFFDNETKLNFDAPNYENLSETEGYTIGGVAMQGRKYDRYGYEQMQEYYGILPSGIGVSVRLVKVPDSLVPECQAILDTFTFN